MAEGNAGLTVYHPGGRVTLTVDDRRHTLRVPNLGDLEDLRELYRDITEELQGYLDFEFRPRATELRAEAKRAKTKADRDPVQAELRKLTTEQDHVAQDGWGRWWRACFDLLCDQSLPAYDERPADGLPVWMVEAPEAIGKLFDHWRADPSTPASGDDLTTVLQRLTDRDG